MLLNVDKDKNLVIDININGFSISFCWTIISVRRMDLQISLNI